MIQMTIYQTTTAYLLRLDNAAFKSLFISINLIFFAQEIKYMLCRELKLQVGEIGSIEVEHTLGAMFIYASYGSCGYEQTLG
jgi:hypothetical protein